MHNPPDLGPLTPEQDRAAITRLCGELRSYLGTGGSYSQWAADEAVLGQIGRALFTQRAAVMVRIPANLAAEAVRSWERDDEGGDLPSESSEQASARHRAGTLALIGLAIKESGRPDGHDVTAELNAWEIGNALEAAEDLDLLADIISPPHQDPS